MGKAADAFRTISEVAEWLEVPAHVLRFWESKFTQIKPVKRAGGRRYYRPADMSLLGGIKVLLHDQGMTIKGAQKYLREHGIQEVCRLSPSLDDESHEELSGIALDVATDPARPADVLAFARSDTSGSGPESDGAETAAPVTADDSIALDDAAIENPPPQTPQDTDEDAPLAAPKAKPEALSPADDAPTGSPEPEAEPTPDLEDSPVIVSAPDQPPVPADASEPVEQAGPAPLTQPDLPEDPADSLDTPPGLLTALSALPRPISPEIAARLAPLVATLKAQTAPNTRER